MNNPSFVTLAAAISLVLAACSSTPVTAPTVAAPAAAPPVEVAAVAAKPAPAPAPVAAIDTPAPRPVAAATVASVALPAHLDPTNPISSERSVYFDFDAYLLKNEFTGMLERHGKYLASRPSLSIKIEGNADERGSAEYNLALGQRRAEAVLRALKIHGVRDAQMEAISWGEERPKATGQHEAVWSLNRRADLAYPRQ